MLTALVERTHGQGCHPRKDDAAVAQAQQVPEALPPEHLHENVQNCQIHLAADSACLVIKCSLRTAFARLTAAVASSISKLQCR